jgi:hypothetical protein
VDVLGVAEHALTISVPDGSFLTFPAYSTAFVPLAIGSVAGSTPAERAGVINLAWSELAVAVLVEDDVAGIGAGGESEAPAVATVTVSPRPYPESPIVLSTGVQILLRATCLDAAGALLEGVEVEWTTTDDGVLPAGVRTHGTGAPDELAVESVLPGGQTNRFITITATEPVSGASGDIEVLVTPASWA